MTAKEFLKQYEEAERIAKRMKIEYDQELLQIDSIKSPMDTDGTPHGSGVSKIVEQRAIRLSDKALRYKVAQLEALKKRQQVFNAICTVPDIEGQILYERYINLKKWEDVADSVHMSIRHVHNLHGKALEKIKDCIELHFLKC